MYGNLGAAQANSLEANSLRQQYEAANATDTAALSRRIEQLERRVDTLESGLSRREPINQPIITKGAVVMWPKGGANRIHEVLAISGDHAWIRPKNCHATAQGGVALISELRLADG